MNLRHLRCFIAVAEELHFGRAARRLHVEQSPLSRTIRQLEADLGVTLLERTPRGVRLTPAGQVFLEEARRVLLTLEQAQTKARAVAAGVVLVRQRPGTGNAIMETAANGIASPRSRLTCTILARVARAATRIAASERPIGTWWIRMPSPSSPETAAEAPATAPSTKPSARLCTANPSTSGQRAPLTGPSPYRWST